MILFSLITLIDHWIYFSVLHFIVVATTLLMLEGLNLICYFLRHTYDRNTVELVL
ncbi:hypothetical protein L1D51_06660 [Pseudoalteromonas shioyasakiensis]|nr:hypothetical protein [Pseudoalteromonas shioyasakiensis]